MHLNLRFGPHCHPYFADSLPEFLTGEESYHTEFDFQNSLLNFLPFCEYKCQVALFPCFDFADRP